MFNNRMFRNTNILLFSMKIQRLNCLRAENHSKLSECTNTVKWLHLKLTCVTWMCRLIRIPFLGTEAKNLVIFLECKRVIVFVSWYFWHHAYFNETRIISIYSKRIEKQFYKMTNYNYSCANFKDRSQVEIKRLLSQISWLKLTILGCFRLSSRFISSWVIIKLWRKNGFVLLEMFCGVTRSIFYAVRTAT